MKKIIDRIVQSAGSPGTHDLWLTENNELKVYDNDEWKTIGGGSSSGGGSDITLAQALTRVFKLDKKPTYDSVNGIITHSEESVPLPDFVLSTIASAIYDIDYSGTKGIIDISKTIEEEGVAIPENVRCTDHAIYELLDGIEQEEYKVVPFDELQESDALTNEYGNGEWIYFMYKLDKLSENFNGSLFVIHGISNTSMFRANCYECIYIIKYNGEYYFTNAYEGD